MINKMKTAQNKLATETQSAQSRNRWTIEQTDASGNLISTIAGIGRNRGTWDTECFSIATARRWLRQMKAEFPGNFYRIASVY